MSVSTFQETSKDNKATDPIDLHEVPCDDSTMVDTPETNLAPPPVSTIPHSVQTSVDVSCLEGSRIFLDLRRFWLPFDISYAWSWLQMLSGG